MGDFKTERRHLEEEENDVVGRMSPDSTTLKSLHDEIRQLTAMDGFLLVWRGF